MEVIPAVDIMGGKIVRLSKGEPNTAKIYGGFGEPLQAAKRWAREGATYLHVVDLDAAMGQGDNRELISTIIREVGIPVQVGGGLRSREAAEEILSIGAGRVIIATLAFERENIIKLLVEHFGSKRIMVALDYIGKIVMTKGWKGSTGLTLKKAMEKFLSLGVELFLLTSISRDGLLIGPDYTTLKNVAKYHERGLFVAGGINSLDDLHKLKMLDVDGVIIGKAFYEGNFRLKEALAIVKG